MRLSGVLIVAVTLVCAAAGVIPAKAQVQPLTGNKFADQALPGPTAASRVETSHLPESEESTLRAAGLTTDDAALLAFFSNRATVKADSDKLLALARRLGDPVDDVRAKAAGQLVAWGPAAIPSLRHVINDLDDPVASEHAQHCLEWLEGRRRGEVPIAAARLLAARKTPGAADVFLAYLPFADDLAVVDGVKAALVTLVAKSSVQGADSSAVRAALVTALKDPVPLRRAIAVEVLCAAGQPDVLPEVRKLLADSKPQVRLRTALALAERQDERAIGVLIELLAELPPAPRRQAEDALQQLAGDWAPNPNLIGDDEVSRKIRRDAWAAWWSNTDGATLLAAFRKRTLSPDDLTLVLTSIEKLGDKVFATRERAVADLVALGPKVVPLLQQATQSSDLERAQRAAACLKQIALSEDKHKLPPAAARLLALRKPEGATEALLAYLPFNNDEFMRVEIGAALKSLLLAASKPDAILIKTLSDALPIRRIAAAEALASARLPEQFPALRKLLNDPEPTVRLRVAVALTYARDAQAVPALIDLAADMPKGQAWEAEDLLYRLAGANAPSTQPPSPSVGGVQVGVDEKGARKKFRDDWVFWWKQHGTTVDLAQLEAVQTPLGYTLVTEISDNGNSRVLELDRNGKPRWQIDNISFPVDAWFLPGNRIIIAECNGNRVTERDLTGKILWQVNNLQSNSVNAQRLANGNTFIAVYNGPLLEVDRAGKTLLSFTVQGGVQAACKMANGHIVCLTQQGTCVRLDAAGKEIKRFSLQRTNNWTSGLDVTPKGNILVSQSDNMITEYDLEGKVLWQAKAANNTSATRLQNGHTLVASYNNQTVSELDPTGRVIWEYRAPQGYHPFRARQR